MMIDIISLLFIFSAPAGILFLTKKAAFLNRLGSVTLCYLVGLVLAISPLSYDKGLMLDVASVMIALAIPLLLFGFDLFELKKLAGKTILSFFLVIVTVILVSSLAAVLGRKAGLPCSAEYAGMAIGLYIGGTPNMFAIGSALLRDRSLISIVNLSDSIFGGFFFFLVLTVLKQLYRRFLGSKESVPSGGSLPASSTAEEESLRCSFADKKQLKELGGVVLLAVLCLGLGVLLELAVMGNLSGSLYIMITVSVLGMAFSFIRPIREVRGTYPVGQYMVLVFSLALSMSIDLRQLISGILPTFLFFSGIQIVSCGIHFLLCRLFHIDGGIALVTILAGIYGPPFIAPAANAYGDRSLIAPGVICGTFGLVVGNLLGLVFGKLLMTVL